ncbi:unnamed protein product [Acanthosepion pharaonis]|uniref:Uncharacterized protein n=1 Tax=Acanthosepion pharaonis TaxID=158019 RepID=A0A812CJL9_ACAPH|nr:unnamed protein product [Sepia pharaonis]
MHTAQKSKDLPPDFSSGYSEDNLHSNPNYMILRPHDHPFTVIEVTSVFFLSLLLVESLSKFRSTESTTLFLESPVSLSEDRTGLSHSFEDRSFSVKPRQGTALTPTSQCLYPKTEPGLSHLCTKTEVFSVETRQRTAPKSNLSVFHSSVSIRRQNLDLRHLLSAPEDRTRLLSKTLCPRNLLSRKPDREQPNPTCLCLHSTGHPLSEDRSYPKNSPNSNLSVFHSSVSILCTLCPKTEVFSVACQTENSLTPTYRTRTLSEDRSPGQRTPSNLSEVSLSEDRTGLLSLPKTEVFSVATAREQPTPTCLSVSIRRQNPDCVKFCARRQKSSVASQTENSLTPTCLFSTEDRTPERVTLCTKTEVFCRKPDREQPNSNLSVFHSSVSEDRTSESLHVASQTENCLTPTCFSVFIGRTTTSA